MIDRVDAENRIERAVVERQRLIRVGSNEAHLPLETGLAREPLPSCHCIIEQLNTNGLASRQLGKVKGRPARAPSHIQQSSGNSQSQLPTKPFELAPREPAVLADILTERSAANLLVYVRGEVAIVSLVVP